jgi:hypothetical protein
MSSLTLILWRRSAPAWDSALVPSHRFAKKCPSIDAWNFILEHWQAFGATLSVPDQVVHLHPPSGGSVAEGHLHDGADAAFAGCLILCVASCVEAV